MAGKRGAARRSRSMSDQHKEALAEGREQGRAVRRYLEALDSSAPRRGRPRSAESIEAQLAVVRARYAGGDGYAGADALTRLHLAQKQIDLEADLRRLTAVEAPDLALLEAQFVKVAQAYGERKGLSREAWLAAGVKRKVLDRAGIR